MCYPSHFIDFNLMQKNLGLSQQYSSKWALNEILMSFLKMNTPTGASANPKNFDSNKNLNMNLIQIETWNLRLETGNWNLKPKLGIKTWNWNLELNLEIETWNWSLKLKLEIGTWNWNLKLKPETTLEIEPWS